MADKVCVLPFTHLHIRSNGRPQVCCAFEGGLWKKTTATSRSTAIRWTDKTGGDALLSVESLVRRSTESGHRMEAPASYQLDVGNLCNLKCRMCNGLSSSRIERDPVHQKWATQWAETVPPVAHNRFPNGDHWFEQKELVVGELLRNAASPS